MTSPIERLEAWCDQRTEWVNQNWPGVGMQTDRAKRELLVIDAYRSIIARYRKADHEALTSPHTDVSSNWRFIAQTHYHDIELLADAVNPEEHQ